MLTCTNGMPSDQQVLQFQMKAKINSSKDESIQRRSANYKPNIWKYDYIESLTSEYTADTYKHAEKLKEEVRFTFVETVEPLAKLELVDSIGKLGLATLFEEEIKDALDMIMCLKDNNLTIEEDLYATALRFRLLRQYGYNVSQDIFIRFVDETGNFMQSTTTNVKAMLELFEASYLALEGEKIMDKARMFSTENIKTVISNSDVSLAKQLSTALELPLHWRLEWYNVTRNIHEYGKVGNINSNLLKLAKLHFNMVQATHQKDLKEIIRWWRNLGMARNLSFSRDRIIESYLFAVGVNFEPQYKHFRNWLAKVCKFIITIDDVYDVYGSLQELELFTKAVDRWDSEEIQQLPECMKICFQALYDTTNEIAFEIQRVKGGKSVLPHLRKAWENFCKALLVEAKWYNQGYTPSLQEYLDNGWISSGGSVLSIHVLFGVAHEITDKVLHFLKNGEDLVYHISIIIRLTNDQGTSAAELERGDAPSSILCYMREANVSEEVAREHIRSIITKTWKSINNQCIAKSLSLVPFAKYITNIARVSHFIYQNGDGYGVQDHETRDQVVSLLIEPLALD
ncbi:unnamed protein product [Ilex paraguariensis]|uniref:Alpha-farnesene synthase n=1 Tax=Ilex paraguariensis TaxID=185542 RepID=A0ABC8REI3_9AQUA